MGMARTPRPKPPADIMVALERTATALRAQRLDALAGEVEAAYEALRCMLDLTKYGDCLWADEIRNILNIRHQMKSKRGTSMDPMTQDRIQHRLGRK
jgi:hypothetical protein